MNCLWQDLPDTTDNRGWRRVECVRCGRRTNPTPFEFKRIRAECLARPLFSELGYWLAIAIEAATGINQSRWLFFKRKIGLSGTCSCEQRVEVMNTLGGKVAAKLAKLRERFSRRLAIAGLS